MVAEPSTGRAAAWQHLAYALPALPLTMMLLPVGSIIPGYYAKYTATTMAAIGFVFLVTRIFDAVIDPAIGYWSDRTRHLRGGRKGWIGAGTIVCLFATWWLMTPPPDAGMPYLLAATIALFAGWSLIEIPYRAWSAELSRDERVRSRLSALVGGLGSAGTFIFMAIPLLPVFDSSAIGPQTLGAMAWAIIIPLPLLVALAFALVPSGHAVAGGHTSIADVVKALGRNRPLRLFGLSMILGGMGTGVFTALFFLFVDGYLGLGESFALLFVGSAAANILAMPVWHALAVRWGKHRALAASWIAVALVQVGIGLVGRGDHAFAAMLALSVAYGMAEAATKMTPYALLGDIVDYETLRSGVNRGGSFFAAMAFLSKLNFAVGGGCAFLLLDLLGQDVKTIAGGQATGFLAVFILLPVLLWLLAGLCLARFPLDRRRQDIVRRAIDRAMARRA